jgi:hypothetical protein
VYFSDYATYGTFGQLQTASNFSLSSGNTMAITPSTSGYVVSATNSSISSTISSCTVSVAGGVASTLDGAIHCP